jgi:hypothetical protein
MITESNSPNFEVVDVCLFSTLDSPPGARAIFAIFIEITSVSVGIMR